MYPLHAFIVLGLALGVSAVVWILGAHLRAGRGEAPMIPFRSMMGRGLIVPTAMIFMAADFAVTPTDWLLWTAIAFGGWIVTLGISRAIIGVIGYQAKTTTTTTTTVDIPPAAVRELEAEAAR